MLRNAVLLDAAMSVPDALVRLARRGYWFDPEEPHARSVLEEFVTTSRDAAKRAKVQGGFDMTVGAAAELLGRDVDSARVAIRRQDGITIFWYARRMDWVLQQLYKPQGDTVLRALDLHEWGSDPTKQVTAVDESTADSFDGLILSGQNLVAVADNPPRAKAGFAEEVAGAPSGGSRGAGDDAVLGRGGGGTAAAPSAPAPARAQVEVRAYPRAQAPRTVLAAKPFDLVVGLAESEIPGLASTGRMVLTGPAGAKSIGCEVQVVADGFSCDGPWRRPLVVEVAAPTAASVTFSLTPKAQQEPVRLSSITVHYLLDGVRRGSASRHVVVERTAGAAPPADDRGVSWAAAEPPPPPMTMGATTTGPDIEVDISKPDGNPATGVYNCVIRNRHGVPVSDAGHTIKIGTDPESFSESLIKRIQSYTKHAIVDTFIMGRAADVAALLPAELFSVLRAVAAKVKPRPVTLQLNSAEPCIPWELAEVDPPLDPKRPPILGAQVIMGRWILGTATVASPPRENVEVKAMAVMAGRYSIESNLPELPKSIEEAAELTKKYAQIPAVPLDSTMDDLYRLLTAALVHQYNEIGGAEAVHFAGHGEVNPNRLQDAALFLKTGEPLAPDLFRKTELGRRHKPFMFLNACMVGAAGEMLASFGGFPGMCLAGGFSGLVAPLWAVNDVVAKAVALEFYDQVFGQKKPVATALYEMRGAYSSKKPVASLLAYVYYGNPFLTLTLTR